MIPLVEPDLRGNERAYLEECVRTNWVSSAGPYVTELERQIAAVACCEHGVAIASGTAALQLVLEASGLTPGNRVAIPDWTFAATANAVIHAGFEPVFVDVSASSWTLDPKLLSHAFRLGGPPVRAVIAVHALGHPADMDPIAAVCRSNDGVLIEDAAGAIGAVYRGRIVGGLGRAGCFSFNGNKTVTAGGGGGVVTNDGALAARVRHLSTQARTGPDYAHDAAGHNFRMTNLNAAVGLAQLERLDEMLAAKRRIAGNYDRALSGRADLRPMPRLDWATSGCWLYSVLTASLDDARALVAHLSDHGATARPFWLRLSRQAPYAGYARVTNGQAERLSGTVVSLPSSSHLSDEQQDRVISALNAWHGSDLEWAA